MSRWRRPEARSSFWLQRQRDKVEAGLQALDEGIEVSLPDLAFETSPLGLLPIAVGSVLGFVSFWMPDLDWGGRSPRLAELVRRLDARPAWAATAPHLPAGTTFPRL
jgi:glutathione S-transferase